MLVADRVQGIGRVGDRLSEEDFFVGVEGVDNEEEENGVNQFSANLWQIVN